MGIETYMDKRIEKAAIEIKKAKIDSKQLDIPLQPNQGTKTDQYEQTRHDRK